MRVTCPMCEGKGYVLGIDERYPQDGNVALRCPTCRWSGTVLSDSADSGLKSLESNVGIGPDVTL